MCLDAVVFWSPQVTRFVREFDILWPMHLDTLKGIGASNMFFLWSTPSKSALFHKLHPVTRGTCYCQYKMLYCFLGVVALFLVGCPLSKCDWRQTCPFLCTLGSDRHRLNACDLCKAHMKELQEFNQHWDQKAGSSTSRWWEWLEGCTIRMLDAKRLCGKQRRKARW